MSNENIMGTNFIITNRDLITKFGVNSAIMPGELYGRMNYFRKRNELKLGYFFATKDSIEKNTKLSAYKQRKATSILQIAGILDVINKYVFTESKRIWQKKNLYFVNS